MKHLLFFAIAFAVFFIGNSIQPEFCSQPQDAGSGPSFEFYVYYDRGSDKCKPFLYHGQGGNANRFKNERDCIRNCSTNVNDIYPMNDAVGRHVLALSINSTPPSGERAELLMTDLVEACRFPKAKGECQLNLLRYYYDPVHDKCKKFIWTGCIGNGNRFTDQQICNKTCAGVHDDTVDVEGDEPDTPVAIICGVLLAVIVVSIFVTVIVLTVKSKKKHAKKEPGKSKDAQTDAPLRADDIEMR